MVFVQVGESREARRVVLQPVRSAEMLYTYWREDLEVTEWVEGDSGGGKLAGSTAAGKPGDRVRLSAHVLLRPQIGVQPHVRGFEHRPQDRG